MNYLENTIEWQVGDIVIHDADAKEHHMLMIVIATRPEKDLWITDYLYHPEWNHKDEKYCNEKQYLHDPRRFGIIVPNIEKVV